MTFPLVIHNVPEESGNLSYLNNPFVIILCVTAMLTVSFIAPVCNNKASSYWAKFADEIQFINRFFGYYWSIGYDRSRAPDSRIYRQDVICTNNIISGISKTSPLTTKINKYTRGAMGGFSALAGSASQVFTGLVYIFVCVKAWAGAFGIGAVTQYIGSTTILSSGVFWV
ncbi:MAG: hypothetical protein LBS21_10275 [Clostridiales bacterium]|nr:hypothetical protein [Clostridiales bacterium]